MESCIAGDDGRVVMSFTMKSNPTGFGGMSPFISSLLGGTGVDDRDDMILRGFDGKWLALFARTCAVAIQGEWWKLGFHGESTGREICIHPW